MNKVVSKWLMQRVAAVLLLPLLIWFLFHYDNLMTFSYNDAINFFNNKLNTIFLSLIFILAFFHMRIGMGEIFEDSIHGIEAAKYAKIDFVNIKKYDWSYLYKQLIKSSNVK